VIRAWVADARAAREIDPRDAVRIAAGPDGPERVWIDIENVDMAGVTELLQPLHIHPLVVDDMVNEVNRPKVDTYGDYLYVALHSARWEDERPQLRELDLVLGMRWLITYHDAPTRSVTAAAEVLPRRCELLADGPAKLLHFLLDVLVDHYLPIADKIAEGIDEFEECVFDAQRPLDHTRVIRLKRGMSALRRIVGPQRDTVLALTRDEFKPIPSDVRPYLRDVYDRLARVSDLLDSFRDEITTVLELNVAMVSNRLNEVIKRLTVIATVGLPLTLVTGYWGMNFALPEYHVSHPHVLVLGTLVLSALGTLAYLKLKRWL
jgi:magnesium transporter